MSLDHASVCLNPLPLNPKLWPKNPKLSLGVNGAASLFQRDECHRGGILVSARRGTLKKVELFARSHATSSLRGAKLHEGEQADVDDRNLIQISMASNTNPGEKNRAKKNPALLGGPSWFLACLGALAWCFVWFGEKEQNHFF